MYISVFQTMYIALQADMYVDRVEQYIVSEWDFLVNFDEMIRSFILNLFHKDERIFNPLLYFSHDFNKEIYDISKAISLRLFKIHSRNKDEHRCC